mmetsp:Transcript_76073/g.240610  ORF Transcript_76073/g.240610 Transcript_76073/m.240610 type:complete len:229 (+) Transcript_76073:1003-1689(+)
MSAPDRVRSSALFAASECRLLRPSTSSLICAVFSASWASVLFVFSEPARSERRPPWRSSYFCCRSFISMFVVRRSPASFAKSDLVVSWSTPSRSFSRWVVPRSFWTFSTCVSVCASPLRRVKSSPCCCSMQSLLSSMLRSLAFRRLVSCWTCAWTSRTCSATGRMMLCIWRRMKACMPLLCSSFGTALPPPSEDCAAVPGGVGVVILAPTRLRVCGNAPPGADELPRA